MYTCCRSLSLHSLCSVSALYPMSHVHLLQVCFSPFSLLFQHCALCLMYSCWSLSVHSLCSVSALCPMSHVHLLQVCFSPIPLFCLSIVPYISCTPTDPFQSIPSAVFQHCALLSHVHLQVSSVHSLCSVSALCPMSHVQLLVSFSPFSLLFQHCALCLMYNCWSLSVHSLCSVSALCPMSHVHLLVSTSPFSLLCFSIVPYVSCTAAGLFQSIPSAQFQHCTLLPQVHLQVSFSPVLFQHCVLLSHYTSCRSPSAHFLCSVSALCPLSDVHLLQVSFSPFPLLGFSIVSYVSCTPPGIFQFIPSAPFQHCALLSHVHLQVSFIQFSLLCFSIVPYVSCTPAVLFQSILSALFQHCALYLMYTCRSLSFHSLYSVSALCPMSYVHLQVSFNPFPLLGFIIVPYFLRYTCRSLSVLLCFSIVSYCHVYTSCRSLSVHFLCSVLALCPTASCTPAACLFQSIPSVGFQHCVLCLMCTWCCSSLSVHSLCSVSALYPMSHVQLLVSFSPFPLLSFSIVPYYPMYTYCRSLSVHSLCSVSALCPTVSCTPAASLFESSLSSQFQHCALLSHVHLLQVSFNPSSLFCFSIVPYCLIYTRWNSLSVHSLCFSIVPYCLIYTCCKSHSIHSLCSVSVLCPTVSCTPAVSLFQSILSSMFQHCALLSHVHLLQVSLSPFCLLRFSIVPYCLVYTCCKSLSVHSLFSVSALCRTVSCTPAASLFQSILSPRFQYCALLSHVHLLQVSFNPFSLLGFSIVPYCLMYTCCKSLSIHSLFSVSALCPTVPCTPAENVFESIRSSPSQHWARLSHVHLLQVSFLAFSFLRFSIVPYCLMYICCKSLSIHSLCSVSALCPTVSCTPAASLFHSILSSPFQHCALLSHVHLLQVSFNPFSLLRFSIVPCCLMYICCKSLSIHSLFSVSALCPTVSCTPAASLFHSILSSPFQHCALLSHVHLLQVSFILFSLLRFSIDPYYLMYTCC